MHKHKESFIRLEKAVKALMKENEVLKNRVFELEKGIEVMRSEHKEMFVENQELKNINNQLKIANALDGNPEHRKLMKLKINQLIKEVDLCMAEIKNISL
ncbi:hypothetical protein KRX57_09230 [Weeksellaceae bacterium TAE3-ERU29]|nr:hypothetical protein [Weeksellaceae bacterium TAE3-ERU29]